MTEFLSGVRLERIVGLGALLNPAVRLNVCRIEGYGQDVKDVERFRRVQQLELFPGPLPVC